MNPCVDEPICESSFDGDFIWEYETHMDGDDTIQTTTVWKPYTKMISTSIEEAYEHEFTEIDIGGNYRIDLKCYVQQHINSTHKQQRVRRRRCRLPLLVGINEETKEEALRRERLSSPVCIAVSANCIADTTYYGSPFIYTWLLMFTEGKMEITFDRIFCALLNGLIQEGQCDYADQLCGIAAALIETEWKTRGKNSKDRIKALQTCCIKLYTKNCYIYRVVNTALRDSDQKKLYSVGPFCYLLFNSIGQSSKTISCKINCFQRFCNRKKIEPIILYRGDHNSGSAIEEYRRAVGDKSKRFKWVSFISTSIDRNVAESFAGDMLYIIEIRHTSNEDQFTNVTAISCYEDEQEILLLPGVQFQVIKLDYDNKKGRHLVYIKINSSYISKLI